MREISAEAITSAVRGLCIEAACILEPDILNAISQAKEQEESSLGREILVQLEENARIARENNLPICQDTGLAVVFVEIGLEVRIKGDLVQAINEGIRQGYRDGYLRKSVVSEPLFRRINTGDNTPAVIHLDLAPGDKLRILLLPKGGGSENMSGLRMLTPAAGLSGVKDFVISKVREAGSNPCPPIVVGVGLGGTMEKAALLAKKALARPLGSKNPDPQYASFEEELLEEINRLGIGPAGLGGRVTALAVHVEVFPCHITSLPVAVNIECHAHRHKEIVL
jgi:fumarate hydratase subunit alpha